MPRLAVPQATWTVVPTPAAGDYWIQSTSHAVHVTTDASPPADHNDAMYLPPSSSVVISSALTVRVYTATNSVSIRYMGV